MLKSAAFVWIASISPIIRCNYTNNSNLFGSFGAMKQHQNNYTIALYSITTFRDYIQIYETNQSGWRSLWSERSSLWDECSESDQREFLVKLKSACIITGWIIPVIMSCWVWAIVKLSGGRSQDSMWSSLQCLSLLSCQRRDGGWNS